ncbi:hypothetical protein [Xanthomonas sp. XNM01]|uniref:hypothetical protein n=1 Tax=Xanthomonas sp. XNM01 TaxID=2769289 RepID=UPI00177DE3E1|nr:hypothetical protein [Xanthomonas sp. XNM01]MBD9369482.1 hypothetical protein [Xanthomonas sp. XNM01]
MKRAGWIAALLMVAGTAQAGAPAALREACRAGSGAEARELEDARARCEVYRRRAGRSAPDALLALLYLDLIDQRLQERRVDGDGAARAGVPALPDDLARPWPIREAMLLLTRADTVDADAARVIGAIHASRAGRRLDGGVDWAALQVGMASAVSLRPMSMDEGETAALRAVWPEVERQLQALPDGSERDTLQVRAALALATLLERGDAAAAFDVLIDAWRRAGTLPAERRQAQRRLADLLEVHPGLVAAQRAAIWGVVGGSTEPAFKDRLVLAMAQAEADCLNTAVLYDAAHRYAQAAAAADRAAPAVELRALAAQGDAPRLRARLRMLACLSARQLQRSDPDGTLADALAGLFPPASRDPELAAWLGRIESGLRQP